MASRALNIAYPVLLEVPLPSSPPTPWDSVWGAIAEAATSAERGGETGWKGCITAARLALDRWREIEREDMGPGWTRPADDDLRSRTTRQRLDNIRWHLRAYSNLGPHSGAEEFTRDDAILMLSTLSALLAVRKPGLWRTHAGEILSVAVSGVRSLVRVLLRPLGWLMTWVTQREAERDLQRSANPPWPAGRRPKPETLFSLAQRVFQFWFNAAGGVVGSMAVSFFWQAPFEEYGWTHFMSSVGNQVEVGHLYTGITRYRCAILTRPRG